MMLALGNSEKCSRCIQTDTPFTVGSHQKMTVSVGFGTPGPLRELKERIITPGPNHPSNRSSEARGVWWVKTNMAQLFERNPPSREISSFLRRSMHDYLSQTESTATMQSISRFYHEVETAVGMLEKKYVDQSRNKEIQQIVGTQRMVINALKKIHTKIVIRLRPTPNLTTLGMVNFPSTFRERFWCSFKTYCTKKQLRASVLGDYSWG